MKRTLLLLILLFSVSGWVSAQGTLIPNPDNGDFKKGLIEFNGSLYGNYLNENGKNQLVRYDGNSLVRIPNPDNGVGYTEGGYIGDNLKFNNKIYSLYKNASGKGQLVSFDGTTSTLIPNPDESSYECGTMELVFNGAIYVSYYSRSEGNPKLAKYDGISWHVFANPATESYYSTQIRPVEFNGAFYVTYTLPTLEGRITQLARCDGNSVTIIDNSAPGTIGPMGGALVVNNVLYLKYQTVSNLHQLAKCTGYDLQLIPNPEGSDYFGGAMAEFDGALHVVYKYPGETNNKLVKYDGVNFSVIPSSFSYGCGWISGESPPFRFNNKLMFIGKNGGGNDELFSYDGISWVDIGTPKLGFFWGYTEFNGKLYFTFKEYQYGNYYGGPGQLAQFDGASWSLTPNPDNPTAYQGGCQGAPFVFNNKLYNQYLNQSNHQQLIRFPSTSYPTITGATPVTSIGQSIKLKTPVVAGLTKTWYSHSETEYWQSGSLMNGLTSDEIDVTPQTTTYYSVVYTDNDAQSSVRSALVRIPFYLTISGDYGNANRTYIEGRGVQLDSKNTVNPAPQYYIPTGADAGAKVYSTLFDLNLSPSWDAFFIIRKNNFWEIYQGSKSAAEPVYTLLYRTKNTFPTINSGGRLAAGSIAAETQTGTRPPQDAVWIRVADSFEVTLTLTGVSEDYSALPVTLTYFNAKLNGSKKVELKWETASEQNSDHFDIERSADLKSFDVIAKANAKNNSSEKTTYQLIDENPIRGINYYRLKQTDLDGISVYYRIVAVRVEGTDAPYPNPSNGKFLNLDIPATAMIKLTTLKGEIIPFETKSISDTRVQLLPKNALSPGLYIVTANGLAKKWVVQ